MNTILEFADWVSLCIGASPKEFAEDAADQRVSRSCRQTASSRSVRVNALAHRVLEGRAVVECALGEEKVNLRQDEYAK